MVKNGDFTFLLLELILADEVADLPHPIVASSWSFVEKTSVKQNIKQQVCSNFQMMCTDQMYPPPPIDHRFMEHCYTK